MKKLYILTALAAMILPLARSVWAQQTPATLPYQTGFEAGDDSLWSFTNGTNGWYIGSAVSKTGTQSLYVSNNAGQTNAYTLSGGGYSFAYRAMRFSEVGPYEYNFDWKSGGESTYDYIRVFLAPTSTVFSSVLNSNPTLGSPASTTAFGSQTPAGWKNLVSRVVGTNTRLFLNNTTSATAAQWYAYEGEVAITAADTGTWYLVFLWANDNSSGTQPPAAIDNLLVRKLTCHKPINLTLNSVVATEAVVSWQTVGDEDTWSVYVNDTFYTFATANQCTLYNLNPNTAYSVSIRAICSATDSSSMSAALEFRTPCSGVVPLPYVETFESYTTGSGSKPDCWTILQTANAYPYINTNSTYHGTGTKIWSAYHTSAYRKSMVATHAVEMQPTGLYLSLYCSANGVNGMVELGYMTSLLDTSTFTPVATFIPTAANTPQTIFGYVEPADVTVDTLYVAIRTQSTNTSTVTMYMDDLTVKAAGACRRVQDLTYSDVSTGHVTLTWRDNTSLRGDYEVRFGTSNNVDNDEFNRSISGVLDTTYTFDTLQGGNTYYFWVRNFCGNDTLEWEAGGPVFIPCQRLTHADLPLRENFDSYTAAATATIDHCWYKKSYTSNANFPYPNATNHTPEATAGKSLYFNPSTGVQSQWVVLQGIENVNQLLVNFWMRSNNVNGYVEVGVMTDFADTSTFTPISQFFVAATNTWYEQEVSLASYQDTGAYIAFRVSSLSGSITMYIDDILVKVDNCHKPASIVPSFSSNGTTLSWNQIAEANNYALMIEGVDTINAMVDTAYTIAGLTAMTTYNVHLRSQCSLDTSSWINFSFMTPTDSLPYYEDFNSLTSANSNPTGWTHIGQGNAKMYNTTASNLYDGTNCLGFNNATSNNVMVLPSFPEEISGLYLRFWARPYGNNVAGSGSFDVGYVTDPDNPASFVTVNTYPYTENFNAYAEYICYYPSAPAGARMALRHRAGTANATYYWWVDNVEVDVATCPGVPRPTMSNITSDSATITWRKAGDGTTYQVELNGTTSYARYITTQDTSIRIGGLTPAASYKVNVRGVCGDTTSHAAFGVLQTTCDTIRHEDLPLVELFDNYAGNVVHSCWTKMGGPSSLVGTDRSLEVSRMVYFMGRALGASDMRYIVTPAFDSVQDLNVNFWSKRGSENDVIEVGVMDSPTDTASFVLMGSCAAVMGSSWTSFDVRFDTYTGTGKYIGFRAHNLTEANGTWILIDDLVITKALSCTRPDEVSVVEVGTDTANVQIVNHGLGNTYMVTYVSASSTDTLTYTDTVAHDTTVVTLRGLRKSCYYTVEVSTICANGDTTSAVSTYFTTGCDTLTYADLPFREDFDRYSYNAVAYINPCYHRLQYNPVSGNYVGPYPKNAYMREGNYGNTFLFEPGDGNKTQYFSLPAIEAVRGLKVNFGVYRTTINPTIEVGIMTDPTDTTTFTLMQVCAPQVVNGWQDFEVLFNTYQDTGMYITFRARSTVASGNNICIDDIVVREDNCPRPASILAVNFDADSAVLTWPMVDSSASYEVTVTGIGTAIVTDTFYMMHGLAPMTNYNVSIRTLCADGNTSQRYTSTFLTPINTLPYTQDFNTFTTTDFNLPQGWSKVGNGGISYITSGGYDQSTLSFSDALGTNIAVLPNFIVDIRQLYIDFYTHPQGTNTAADGTFSVGYITNPNDPSTFVAVETYSYSEFTTSNYLNKFVTFANAPAGARIAFNHNATSVTRSWMVDNIIVNVNTCPSPRRVNVSNVSTDSAVFSWERMDNNATYLLTIGTRTYTVNDTFYVATGLVEDTPYEVSLARLCGSGSTADTGHIVYNSFRTRCNVITHASLPYIEDFQSYATGAGSPISTCWTVMNFHTSNAPYPYSFNRGRNGATTVLYMAPGANRNMQYAVLPEVDSVNDLMISFWGYATSANPRIEVGVMTDPTDTSTFTLVNTCYFNPASTWREYETYFDTYTGTGKYIALRARSVAANNTVYVDDINLSVAPPCRRPENVFVNGITSNSATLHIVDTTAVNNYKVIRIHGNDTLVIRTTDTVLQIGNLAASTSYTIEVSAICSDSSETSKTVITLSTECGIASLPWREDFNAYATVNVYQPGFAVPNCWNFSYTGSNANYGPQVTNRAGQFMWGDTTNHFWMCAATADAYGPKTYAVLPTFAADVNNLTMSFEYTFETTSYGSLAVGYTTGDNYATDFVAVKTVTPVAHPRFIRDTVSFDSVPATAQRIAFRWMQNTNSTWYAVCIDNINVEVLAQTCAAPEVDSNATTTYNSITVNWTGSDSTEVMIGQGVLTSELPSYISTTGTYTFTGLERSTSYAIGIRNLCNDTLFSEWVVLNVTTDDLACQAPTAVACTDITFDGATIGWTAGGNEQYWMVEVASTTDTVVEGTATNPYTVSGLTSGVTYNVRVRSMCGDNNEVEGDWSDYVPFTTQTCQPVTTITADEPTTSSVTISWQAPATASGSYIVEYGLQGYTAGYQLGRYEVEGTTYTITGLEAETSYDIHVINVCNATLSSISSEAITITTPAGGEQPNGIADVTNDANVSLYPNPANGMVNVAVAGLEGAATVTLVDMNGRECGKWTLEGGKLAIDLAGVAQGAYFVRITGDTVSAIRKLIVR